MKKNIRLVLGAAVMAAVLSSCGEDPVLPTAEFTYEPAELAQYDEVAFSNASTDAVSYAWDFGDGGNSTEMDPTYMFKNTGTFTVKLVATNAEGDNETEQSIVVADPVNEYTIDDTTYTVDADMFWYQSGMGGDPYLRLLTTVPGQGNPDLLKLYPNMGFDELPGTYTWDSEKPVGSFDMGYTAGYAGMSYNWTAIGKTGSDDLVITLVDAGMYKVEGEFVLSIGSYDFSTGDFAETATATLTLSYVGGITSL